MSDDVKAAAAGRTRVIAAGGWKQGDPPTSEQHWDDLWTLANAYLFEHPADEDEPITEEWLRIVGFKSNTEEWLRIVGFKSNLDSPENEFGDTLQLALSEAYFGDDDGHWVTLNRPSTRGQLRRLCAALGVPLKE